MTTFDRFDPFQRRIGEALEGIAPPRPLDYLDDVFRQTARTSQRPRWSFPERWLNVDTAFPRSAIGGRFPLRSLAVLALLLALVAAAAFYVGTQKRLPLPYGPAANGQIAYGVEGDIFVRDTVTGESRPLLTGPSDQGGVVYSPDGQLFAYDNVENGVDHVWVANADGTNPRQVLDRAFTGQSFAWSPDSRSMAIVTHATRPELWIASADGSGARLIELGGLYPWEAKWDPQRPGVLLLRAETSVEVGDALRNEVNFYFVDVNGAGKVLSTIKPTGTMVDGVHWELSGLAISPDGSTVAYNSVLQDAAGDHLYVHLIARDGTGSRMVALPAETGDPYNQAWAVFSPDSRWIAMESWVGIPRTGVRQLALAPVDGSSPTQRLGPTPADHGLVMLWSPDGKAILIHVDDIDDMYLIDPVTGSHELLPWKSDFPDWQRMAD